MGGYSDYNHRYTQFRPHFHDINGYALNKKIHAIAWILWLFEILMRFSEIS